MASAIPLLTEFGQSPWYDNLTRALATGGLDELIRVHGIRGVTRQLRARIGSSCSPTLRTLPTACARRTTR